MNEQQNKDAGLDWAAGMFEGEGTIRIYTYRSPKGAEVYGLQCKVPNTDNGIIDFFSDRWPKSSTRPERPRENRQPQRTWTVSGVKAGEFLRDLEPHLRTPRVQKKTALAFRFQVLKERRYKEDPNDRQRNLDKQRECYDEMKKLNLRGAAANSRTRKQ